MEKQQPFSAPGYGALENVLSRAYNQAASGKGNERHAAGEPFDQQPMQTISALVGGDGGLLFQAIKKIHESQRLNHAAGIAELLGAINYLAGAIIYREAQADMKIAKVEEPLLRRASDREFFLTGSLPKPSIFPLKNDGGVDYQTYIAAMQAEVAASKLAEIYGDGSGKALPEMTCNCGMLPAGACIHGVSCNDG